ncbi:MAG TPA: hypothetical protein PKN08_03245, partial [Opitutaceae bacterium]|nr:hypothetical protein [Opitutaceae bacterium]
MLLPIEKHERLAVRFVEGVEGLPHQRRLFGRDRLRRGRAGIVDLDVVGLLGPTTGAIGPAEMREGQVARGPADPRTKPSRVAQLAQLRPRGDERLLREVFTHLEIAAHGVGDGTGGRLMPRYEHAKRCAVGL